MHENRSCRMATKLASDACERKLSLGERLRMRLHILMCASCKKCEREIHMLREILSLLRLRPEAEDAALSEKDRQRICAALKKYADDQ